MYLFVTKSFVDLTPSELYAIMKIRQEVFIVEQSCPYLDADGKDILSLHLLCYCENELAAYARLVPARISYEEISIGRVVSSPKFRRKNLGRELMKRAIQEIENLNGRVPIRIGAQAYLKKFYEEFGFEDQNEPYIEDGIPHLIMLRR